MVPLATNLIARPKSPEPVAGGMGYKVVEDTGFQKKSEGVKVSPAPVSHDDPTGAEQAAGAVLVPPFTPLQPHVQGPVPATAVAFEPATHRPEVGAAETATPLAVPQAPLTVWLAEH
jgi:hypothetical protein